MALCMREVAGCARNLWYITTVVSRPKAQLIARCIFQAGNASVSGFSTGFGVQIVKHHGDFEVHYTFGTSAVIHRAGVLRRGGISVPFALPSLSPSLSLFSV